MKTISILVVLFFIGCSQVKHPMQTDVALEQSTPRVSLGNLVFIDPTSAIKQHPLVCGIDRDFPLGQEFAFKDTKSQAFVHAVFPERLLAPANMGRNLVLHGQYQTIQNRKSYTLKQPPKDYQYFVVSSWNFEN